MSGLEIFNSMTEYVIEQRRKRSMTPKEARGFILGVASTLEVQQLLTQFQISALVPNALGRIE